MTPRRVRSPSPLGVLLEGARDATAKAGGVVLDREGWRRAVGARIAARTEPGKLRGGVLTLHVASAAWAQELSFFTGELLGRLRDLGIPVRSLRFRVRPMAPAAPVISGARPPRPRAELPETVRAELAKVMDPALRAAIEEAAALGLSRAPASSTARARAPRAAAIRSAPQAADSRHRPATSRRKP